MIRNLHLSLHGKPEAFTGFPLKHRNSLVTVLSVIVAFCTFCALVRPAMTMESETLCGKVEHIHTAECYAKETKLICDSPDHLHDESCYETTELLTCGKEEHLHTEECLTGHEEGEFSGDGQADGPMDIPADSAAAEPEQTETSDSVVGAVKSSLASGAFLLFPSSSKQEQNREEAQSEEPEDPGEITENTDETISPDHQSFSDDTMPKDTEEENNHEDRDNALPARSATAVSLTVSKIWSDSWNEHDPVTMTLMHTDTGGTISSTGRTLTLSADNNWTGVFEGLEMENESFTWSVLESPVEGYIAQYGEYERVSDTMYRTTVRNTGVFPSQGIIDPDPQLHKTIDYLGDGAANPDTSLTGEDYYRLYLDVIGSHQPVDLLIVADISSSMNSDFGGGMSRKDALDRIVNGTILSGSGAAAERDTDGIIYNFLHMHPENNVAVTCFSGGYSQIGWTYDQTKAINNPITMNWTSLSGMPNGGTSPHDCYARVTRINEPGGTNYTSALLRSEEMLGDTAIANDNHIKVMIFLTDGRPNRIIDQNGRIAVEDSPYTYTQNQFVSFVGAHPDMVPYIIGISRDANSGTAYTTLSSIANQAHLTYYPANDASYLQDALRAIIDRSKFSLVQIIDHLSAYVEYYSEQPDVRVTRTDADGNTTTVWENGGPTEQNYDKEGTRIVQSVTWQADSGGNSTGTVSLTFNPDCLLDGENTFVLSFNVRLTEYAKEARIEHGYNATGDEGTDYAGNTTSSGEEGFPSNDNAYITFTAYDIGHQAEYPHPVVQTEALPLVITKLSATNDQPLENAGFDLYRAVPEGTEGAVLISGLSGEFGILRNPDALTTGSDGLTSPILLRPGRYYLIEAQAPDGYAPLNRPAFFEIRSDGITVISGDSYVGNVLAGSTGGNGVLNLIVRDHASHQLPEAGGTGKKPFISGGLLLAAGSAVCGYTRHRRERRLKRKAS